MYISLTDLIMNMIRYPVKALSIYALMAMALLSTSGCIQVQAPDKPIEIKLTIEITGEVAVKLQGAVNEAIEDNADIF